MLKMSPLDRALSGFRLAGAQRRHDSTKIISEIDQMKSGGRSKSKTMPWQAQPRTFDIFAHRSVSNAIHRTV